MRWLILSGALTNLFFLLLVLFRAKNSLLKLYFSIFAFCTTVWVTTNFIFISFPSTFLLRTTYALGALVMGTAVVWGEYFYRQKTSKKITYLFYGLAGVMMFFCYMPDIFIRRLEVSLTGIHEVYGPFFPVCSAYMLILSIVLLRRLYTCILSSNGIKKEQAKYMFFGIFLFVAVSLLVSFILPLFHISNYAFLDSPSSLFMVGFAAYAMARYRLLDIKLIITGARIFICVYTMVLGVPFWLGFGKHLWMYSLLSMGFLASVGPFIYGKLREKAQNILLKKQLNSQHALKEFAKTLSQIKKTDDLLLQTIEKISHLVQPKHITIYTFSKGEKAYVPRLHRSIDVFTPEKSILKNSNLIDVLSRERRPIFGDVVINSNDSDDAYETVLVPFFAESVLYGIIVIGPKSDTTYSANDLEVFEILANNLSLSVENILFWNEEKTRIMREEQIRRQRAMDNFAASLAHEIDNPIFSIQCSLEALKTTLKQENMPTMATNQADLFTMVSEILQSVKDVSKLIHAVREFSGQNSGELKAMSMNEMADHFTRMVEPQTRYEGITFIKEIESDLFIMGNKIHLVEVLMNLVSNSMHAVRNNAPGNKRITFRLRRNSAETCIIEISDNGYGIDKDLIEDIFVDYVTTKTPGEGSGMGLARAKKISDVHHGKFWAHSDGKGKGATFFIELPLLK